MKRWFFLLLTSLLFSAWFCSCQSTNEASSLIIPDRNKEGLTGPGVRITDSGNVGTNQVERMSGAQYAPKDYLQREQNQPVEGIDFFQYKKKF